MRATNIIVLLLILFLYGSSQAQNVSLLLNRPVEGNGNPGMVDCHFVEDHQGGFYFMGVKNMKLAYNNFVGDIYMIRINSQQQVLCPEQIWKGRARINDAYAFPNGDLLVSGFSYDTLILPGNDTLLFNFPMQEFVVRLNKDGQILYREKFESVKAVSGYSNGNALVVKDLFTQVGFRFLQYSPAGQALDSTYVTGAGFISDVGVSATGDLFVAGGCLDPTLIVNGSSIPGGPIYNGYMFGVPGNGSGLYANSFVDMTCPVVHVEALQGGGAITGGTTMASGPLGTLQVQGPSAFGMDMVVFETDATGTPLWVFETPNSMGQNDFTPATGRFFDYSANFTALWGNFKGQGVTWPGGLQNSNSAYPYSQPLLMGVSGGDVIWLKEFQGIQTVLPHDMLVSTDGCVYFSALVQGTVTFDSVVISGAQYDKKWVVLRYCPMSVSVNHLENKSGIKLFPNPASDQVFICLNEGTDIKLEDLQLTDLNGIILSTSGHITSTGAVLDLSGLVPGFYILKINTDQGIMCFPLIRK